MGQRNSSSNKMIAIDVNGGILSIQAAEKIRKLILSGELNKGDQLPSERKLGEQLGVSRTVVREAIKLLRASGLVITRLGIGTFIAEPNKNILEDYLKFNVQSEAKNIEDLIQARELIEPEIAALAAQNSTIEQIAKMEAEIAEMDVNFNDPERYIEIDRIFHSILAEAANNSVFLLISNSIVALLQESRSLAIISPGANTRSSKHHHEILNAVKIHDPLKASLAMKAHMEQVKTDINFVLNALEIKNTEMERFSIKIKEDLKSND